MNVLIIYDNKSTHVKTIYESLDSFKNLPYKIKFANATGESICRDDLNKYADIIIIHYSVRLSLASHLSPSWFQQLRNYEGPIIAFIQDEFDTTYHTRNWLKNLNIKKVYSLIPSEYIDLVYPGLNTTIDFEQVLAGYIPNSLLKLVPSIPMKRKIHVGYRGRDLPFWYGKFGQEKRIIGEVFKDICIKHNVLQDIEWLSQSRIYNEDWYQFLQSINFMLGTEGGSNILDEYGAIRVSIEQILKINPDASFDEIYSLYLSKHENRIITNQLTPKVFEAAASKTGLILFEGRYSGIIKPNLHFLELKKDFSNAEEVISRSYDSKECIEMINRTYEEVVKNPAYHYDSFLNHLSNDIDKYTSSSQRSVKLRSLFGLIANTQIEIHQG